MDKLSFPTLQKFVLKPSFTLFEPELWRAKDGVCPFCLRKMKRNLKGTLYICSGKLRKQVFHKSKVFAIKIK